MAKNKSENEGWITQMHVFPDQGANENSTFEHDQPYVVEYQAPDGNRRTRLLSEEEVAEIREFNQLPPERVVNAEGEETNVIEEGGE